MNTFIKEGGKLDFTIHQDKIDSIDIQFSSGEITLHITSKNNCTSLTYLDLKEALCLRDSLNEAIKLFCKL